LGQRLRAALLRMRALLIDASPTQIMEAAVEGVE